MENYPNYGFDLKGDIFNWNGTAGVVFQRIDKNSRDGLTNVMLQLLLQWI